MTSVPKKIGLSSISYTKMECATWVADIPRFPGVNLRSHYNPIWYHWEEGSIGLLDYKLCNIKDPDLLSIASLAVNSRHSM